MSKLAGTRKVWILNVALVFLCTGAGIAAAQSTFTVTAEKPAESALVAPRYVDAHLTQMLVVTDTKGKETLQDAATVKPGDIVEYRVTYTNNGKQAVKNLQATLPMPLETEYVSKTAKPGPGLVQASTLDGRYAPEPLMRKVAGKSEVEPVPYPDYRSLRWSLGQLPAGGVAEVVARVRILTASSASSPIGTARPPTARALKAVPAPGTPPMPTGPSAPVRPMACGTRARPRSSA